MELEELKKQYSRVPIELQRMKRWVGYKVEQRDGKDTKVPYNGVSGDRAQVNNKDTWTSFNVAINGVIKYGFEGIGFVLGNGIFGIDLDNHPNSNGVFDMDDKTFENFTSEFIDALDSYTEYSRSGKGIHIICEGTLPEGRRRKGCVEMYDSGRFFVFTGNVINPKSVENRTKEIIPLWEKYVDDTENFSQMLRTRPISDSFGKNNGLSDEEVIRKAEASRNGADFIKLKRGDLSDYHDNKSVADLAFCSHLAFWCNGDKDQIDRIFRSSNLMREKWDEIHGKDTYGNMTINKALSSMREGYDGRSVIANLLNQHSITIGHKDSKELQKGNFMTIGTNGEPVFKMKVVCKDYPYDDTGNAERFYDQFGEYFHWNVTAKSFMFWTGEVWAFDKKDIIRKYANKLIETLRSEVEGLKQQANEAKADGNDDECKRIMKIISSAEYNLRRLANKPGKDAMLDEFKKLHEIPMMQEEFDVDPFAINTKSGLVNLKTGEIISHSKSQMVSKITNCDVSFEEPTEWIAFLNGIFHRGNTPQDKKDTQEIIDCFQMALGLSLTGSTREQVMFLLYGDGSNGKSTFVNEIDYIMGDYSQPIDSQMLMAKNQTSQATQFSLAELPGCRFLMTKETNEGEKLDEAMVKAVTGGDPINAQFKGGKLFNYIPQFKLWMMTNNLPIIRGADYGIWRRIFLIPFLHKFSEEEKDMDMPEKLRKESSKVLGWAIKGYLKYQDEGMVLRRPSCLIQATNEYKKDMDVVMRFINQCCMTEMTACIERQCLYDAFAIYVKKTNEFPLRESKFNKSVIDKGYICKRDSTGDEFYYGIKLIPSYRNLVETDVNAHKNLFKK